MKICLSECYNTNHVLHWMLKERKIILIETSLTLYFGFCTFSTVNDLDYCSS